jgi:hypothetical protein
MRQRAAEQRCDLLKIRGDSRAHHVLCRGFTMFWLKVLVWSAIVILPGGVLLLPLAAALHLRSRKARPAAPAPSE